MAKEFGHANVVGVDLVPVPLDNTTVPQNVRMEIDDINLGLPHFHGQFDLVHLRWVTAGIKGNPDHFSSQTLNHDYGYSRL